MLLNVSDDFDASPGGTLASDFFAVRIDREQLSSRRKFSRAVRPILVAVAIPYVLGWGDVESRLNCEVQVYRRTDEQVVAHYQYTRETEALNHFHSLQNRLAVMSVSDFCAQLGIPAHRVK